MLTQGETLRGRYKIISRLGQGGMGAVYEAHDNVFDTSVALKEVILDSGATHNTKAQEMAQHAFEREAKILAKVNHENIPHVKDYFIEEDSQFLVMELVDGDDLAKLLQERRTPFPVDTLIEWTDRLLDALDYLHSQSPPIIHRDIKPQNLKLTSRKKIKLLDFGIAKGTEANAANTVANQTFVAATLNYSPIEQMLRVLDPTFLAVITHKYSDKIEKFLEQNADVRSDLYALGATLYHLATNISPAEAVKRSIELWDGKPDPLENPSILNPSIPAEFSRFLLKSMEIKRENRFSSAAEMRQALHQFAEFGTKPSLVPTVELNADQFKTAEDIDNSDKMSAKTFVLENPPNTGGGTNAPTTDSSNAGDTEVSPPIPNPSSDSADFVAPDSNPSAETIMGAAPPPQTPSTGQKFNPQVVSLSSQGKTSGQTTQTKQNKGGGKLKFLLLIPVFGLIFLLFAGAAGAFYYLNYVADGNDPVANTNTNTNADSNSNSEIVTDTETQNNTDVFDDNNTNQNVEPEPTATVKTTSSTPASKPTPKPTRKATPRPTPRKTPIVRKTPRPTPRKTPIIRKTPRPRKTPNMRCIYTNDC